VPLYNLMEDAATAEICRAQLWQWIRHEARMDNGAAVTAERFDLLLGAELEQVHHEVGTARFRSGAFSTAVRLFSSMVKSDSFDEFLTLPAYQLLP
jgi:malate synthase